MNDSSLTSSPMTGKIYSKINRPNQLDIEAIATAYSGFILDRMGKVGAVDGGIKPLSPGMRICGPAITCLGPDLSLRRAAIDLADPNDVLVVAAGGSSIACFGDGTARRMLLKNLQGVVLDAPTRDSAALRSLKFSTFSRGESPRNHHYPFESGKGAVNVPVIVGGVLINPGDVIFGDDDGVVVVPRLTCACIARGLRNAIADESEQRNAMIAYQAFDVRPELETAGYEYINASYPGSRQCDGV